MERLYRAGLMIPQPRTAHQSGKQERTSVPIHDPTVNRGVCLHVVRDSEIGESVDDKVSLCAAGGRSSTGAGDHGKDVVPD